MRFHYAYALKRASLEPLQVLFPVASIRTALLDWIRRPARVEITKEVQREPAAPSPATPKRPRFAAEPWFIDHLDVRDNGVYVFGWSILTDLAPRPEIGWFTINGRPFDRMRYPFPRPDVGEVFWMYEGTDLSGFEGSAGDVAEPYPDGLMEICRIGAHTSAIARGRDSWFKPDPSRHGDLPDEARRVRVIGDADPNGFLVSGATDYQRLDRVARALTDRRMHELGRVLDWGAGCGRIARHFPNASSVALTGCDIDRDNVDWCRSHLAGAFVQCDMQPPLPFADSSFELVYAVSVFTHLREAMQLRWLEELSRILTRGGMVLATIHGRPAIDFSRASREEHAWLCALVDRDGLVVTSKDGALDGYADHGGEYVDVLQSGDHVRRVWGRYFDVEHILEAYILHHDLVVLRKR